MFLTLHSDTVNVDLDSQCVYVRVRACVCVCFLMHLLLCSGPFSSLKAGSSSCRMNKCMCVCACMRKPLGRKEHVQSTHTSSRAATTALHTQFYRSIKCLCIGFQRAVMFQVLIFTSSFLTLMELIENASCQ